MNSLILYQQNITISKFENFMTSRNTMKLMNECIALHHEGKQEQFNI